MVYIVNYLYWSINFYCLSWGEWGQVIQFGVGLEWHTDQAREGGRICGSSAPHILISIHSLGSPTWDLVFAPVK